MDASSKFQAFDDSGLSETEIVAWRGLLDVSGALRRRLSQVFQDTAALSEGDFAVLVALTEAEHGALRSSELADAIHWERSRLSHHLGRMQRRGLIRREPHPADSRGAVVELTEAGHEALSHAMGPHLRALKELFVNGLTDKQMRDLAKAMSSLQRHLDGAVDGQ
jgi:DNA-binding MarR family transcriptional regulator